MKGLMIIFNQALSEEIVELFNELEIRGFTKMNDLQGRGTNTGEPKMGTHTWPALNNAIYSFMQKEEAEKMISALNNLNVNSEDQGLKVFSWDVEVAVD